MIFANLAITGNNCKFRAWTRVSGARDTNKRKIETDIAIKNQYRFWTESQSSLKFVFVIIFWSVCSPFVKGKAVSDVKHLLKFGQLLILCEKEVLSVHREQAVMMSTDD